MNFLTDCISKVAGLTKRREEQDSTGHTWTGRIGKDTPLDQCPYVVFDTELSGLNPRKDFIVSIGAIKMSGETIHISKEFYRLVRPKGELTKQSVEIHGITPGELEQADSIGAAMEEFLDFITDAVLVGHFVTIDIKFVNAAVKGLHKKRLTNPAVDTHTLHDWLYEHGVAFRKHYFGGSTKNDLFSLAERYGIGVSTMHDALSDAFLTAQLFQKFLHFLRADGLETLGDLLSVGRA